MNSCCGARRGRRVVIGAIVASAAVYLRSRSLRWGATDDEIGSALPGDELIARADLTATRAITIDAPPEKVWPWVVQLGQGRGGFYSYDALENLIGCDIHSADTIVPEWQVLEVGDEVRLHPGGGLVVAAVDPGRALVLRGGVPVGSTPPPYDFTWSFVVKAAPHGTTRLVVRERYGYSAAWVTAIVEPVEWISLAMSLRMLGGIKQRAEALPRT